MPKNIGTPINGPGNEWFPCVTAAGTLYFGSDRPGGRGRTDIYRSRVVNGEYAAPENLGAAINSPADEYECMVAADESFLILMASGRPDGLGDGDLYISLNEDGRWTPAQNLGSPINSSALEISPYLSPDGGYLFFTSSRRRAKEAKQRRDYAELIAELRGPGNGLGDIYQVDLAVVNAKR